MKYSIASLLFAAILSQAANMVSAQTAGYRILHTYHIPGDGKWDYLALSPVNNNLYVSHGTEVNIINKLNGKSVGTIPNTTGVHGIAFAPQFKKGFVSNGKLNTVTVFNIQTNAVEAEVKTGENPDAIMYDPFSKKVFICDGKSKELSVLDPISNHIIRTIALGGKPETAVSDMRGKLYINIEDKNEIVVLDTKNYVIENHWLVGTGDEPSGLAMDIKTHRLFSGCGNKKLIVINAENGKVVKELPIGNGCDGVAFDETQKIIYSSNREGTLTVIKEKSADEYTVEGNVPTKYGARTLALDQHSHHIYLPTASFEKAPVDNTARPNIVPDSFQVLEVGK